MTDTPKRPPTTMSLTLKVKDGQMHLLRRLGQAMVLHWEELPPNLQDVLIDQAVIVDDIASTTQSEVETFIRSVRSVAVARADRGNSAST
jgi:hypothetical protein